MRDLTDIVILYVSLFLSSLSFVLNAIGAKYGIPKFRASFGIASLLSFLFTGGYFTLIFWKPDPVIWTSVTRGFAITAWVFVWCAPPVLSTLLWQEINAAVENRRSEQTRAGDPHS